MWLREKKKMTNNNNKKTKKQIRKKWGKVQHE